MKQFIKTTAIPFTFILLILAACSDDDDSTTVASTPISGSQKLGDKSFRFTELYLIADGDTLFTIGDIEECDKDDFTRFNSDSTGYDDQGPIKCDPADNQTENFTWYLSSNDSELTVDYGLGDKETYTVIANDGTTLKLEIIEMEDIDSDGNIEEIITKITFRKI